MISPLFYFTLVICGIRYYLIHKKSHLDPKWAKKNVPWHYDHHMGKNQDANWGVTTDWVDRVAGTRMYYIDRNETHRCLNAIHGPRSLLLRTTSTPTWHQIGLFGCDK